MKKILLALSCCAILISCVDNSKVEGEASDDNAAAKKNEENTREVYRAIETGDVTKLDSFFAEDMLDHNGGVMGEDVRGRDSAKKVIAQIHSFFENLKVDVISQSTSADGNYHFAMINMKGKAKENPWGMPVGSEMDDTMVDVIKIKDGKASEHWGFMSMGDMHEMMKGMAGGSQPPQLQPPVKDTTKK